MLIGIHGRAAGEVEAVADVSGKRNRQAHVGFDVAHRAELAALDDLLHARGEGVIAPVECLDELAARAARGLGHALGLVGVGREGLLAQHVLAGLEGANGPVAVEPVGQRIVDGVEVAVGEEGVVVRVDHRNAVLRGELPRPARVACRHGGDLHLGHLPSRPQQCHRRDAGGPEHADAEGGQVAHSRSFLSPNRLSMQGNWRRPTRAGSVARSQRRRRTWRVDSKARWH